MVIGGSQTEEDIVHFMATWHSFLGLNLSRSTDLAGRIAAGLYFFCIFGTGDTVGTIATQFVKASFPQRPFQEVYAAKGCLRSSIMCRTQGGEEVKRGNHRNTTISRMCFVFFRWDHARWFWVAKCARNIPELTFFLESARSFVDSRSTIVQKFNIWEWYQLLCTDWDIIRWALSHQKTLGLQPGQPGFERCSMFTAVCLKQNPRSGRAHGENGSRWPETWG